MSTTTSEVWEFVRRMKEEWTEEDWNDFYEGIDGALRKIAARHGDTLPAPAAPKTMGELSEGASPRLASIICIHWPALSPEDFVRHTPPLSLIKTRGMGRKSIIELVGLLAPLSSSVVQTWVMAMRARGYRPPSK